MYALDMEQGIAVEVGEYWEEGAESPQRVFVDIMLNEEESVEFSYELPDGDHVILGVPIDRIKRLLR